MTVSISKMTIAYYLDSAATGDVAHGGRQDLTSYYTEAKAPAGRWLGSGLAGLSLSAGQEVTRTDAVSIYEQVTDPGTGQRMGRPPMAAQATPAGAKTPAGRTAAATRNPVAGFDLTFSVPKSVSALWAVAGPALQGQLQAAHEQAMSETLAWAEDNVLQSRAGHGGVAHVPVTGLVASAFDHWDSRAGDPQLHTHLVVSNRVQRTLDGQWATLDSYTLHRNVVALSETYNSLLFDRLHQVANVLPESRSADDARLEDIVAAAGLQDADVSPVEGTHRVELAGVPDSLIEEFSTRSRAIAQRKDEFVAEWEATHGRTAPAAIVLQLRQQATLETRTPKDTGPGESLAMKMATWRGRAAATGHTPAEVVAAAVGHAGRTITPAQLTQPVRDQLADWILADTAQRRTTFTRANVIASAERITRLVRYRIAADRHEMTGQLVDRALARAVALTEHRSIAPDLTDPATATRGASVFDHQDTAGIWTTRGHLDDEAYMISRTRAQDGPHLDADTVATEVTGLTTSSGHRLSDDQAAAAARVLGSRQAVEAIIGPAGTGKTTTMAAVATLWSRTHGDGSVVGLAPSAVAAGVLGDELGVATENTAKWLYESVGDGAARRAERVRTLSARLDRAMAADRNSTPATAKLVETNAAQLAEQYAEQARYTLRAGQLLIVDEASMVATAPMAALTRQAEQAGAKVLLVGDPAQLEAVDAGGFLGWMDRTADPARLDMVWRFRNEWERQASLGLRVGSESVLRTYSEQGRIHGDVNTAGADLAYSAWLSDRQDGKESILIASDNATVAELNTRAQTDLVATGAVDVEQTVRLRTGHEAGTGDQILARRNDRSLRDTTGAFIANGTRLTITAINPDGSAAATSNSTGGAVTLDADYLGSSTELGYATTAHRSQGVTVDTGHAVAGAGLSRELLYVAMTRGRQANHVYVDLEADQEAHSPDEWGLLTEQPPAQDPTAVLSGVLKRSSAERTAHEVQAAQHAWSTDLGRMVHELEYLDWAARSERTAHWVDSTYADHPETAQQLRTGESWSRVVAADPATTFRGEPAPEDTVDVVRLHCEPVPPARVLPAPATEEPGPRDTVAHELRGRIDTALTHQVRALREDPPGWVEPITETIPDPARREEVLRSVLLWRAVSDQREADTALGTAPAEKDSTAHYYRAAQDALTGGQPNRVQHAAMQALNEDAVDFSWLDAPATTNAEPVPQPVQTSPSRREPEGPSVG